MWTFITACLWHFFTDFCLQNEWMANNKHNVKHLAGYVHALIITVPMFLCFAWWIPPIIGITHFIIDTRIPIKWWMSVMRKNLPNEPWYHPAAITVDQIWHIVVLFCMVYLNWAV